MLWNTKNTPNCTVFYKTIRGACPRTPIERVWNHIVTGLPKRLVCNSLFGGIWEEAEFILGIFLG